jgi:hypothetical protein
LRYSEHFSHISQFDGRITSTVCKLCHRVVASAPSTEALTVAEALHLNACRQAQKAPTREWQNERRLAFTISQAWTGWCCERCCWNVRLSSSPEDLEIIAAGSGIGEAFAAHDCEIFARENWPASQP